MSVSSKAPKLEKNIVIKPKKNKNFNKFSNFNKKLNLQ